ncbi:MAG: 8-amino-7-oxononanoate synthase [Corynebacterium sp.]|uniref:aminotransferase class I/II-fold pyridoxal phosphate-dependent enzyme n=1 Tax=Corynebacterium sp. TaxID=1720 RepID=UPI0026DD2653|nr:8-amino-7-oxononanoate synthase [Corynebacterium sp.]MDO4761260.1 8-amino-7-oxononanoate synthase [Corynebacterium sp.]
MDINTFTQSRSDEWAQRGLSRQIRHFTTAQTPTANIDGRTLLQFATSDYLGLSTHPALLRAACEQGTALGVGSGGSRLTTGTSIHAALERELATFFGYPDAVFFASGYQCNVAVISALADPDVTFFSDEHNHASLIDGMRMQRHSRTVVYPHRNYEVLDLLLRSRTTPHALIISDGVFSMSGATADLAALRALADTHDAWLLIDDAHGTGTVGETGRGLIEATQIKPDILISTASKALGVEGGIALCSANVAHFLKSQARGFVFSTSPSPLIVGAVREALAIIDREPERIDTLRARIYQLHRRLGLTPPAIPTPIVRIPIGDEQRCITISQHLMDNGIFVPAIRYPTVARNQAIVRITITAHHTLDQINQLCAALTLACAKFSPTTS